MRILCVGNIYPPHDLGGGYEVTWRSSVQHLRSRGHVVRVLSSDYRSPALDGSAELDEDVHRELKWYWRDHAFPRRSPRQVIAIERHNAAVLERQLAEAQPDVVAWWGMGGMSLSLVERVRRARLPAVGVVGDEWLVWGPRADRWSGWLRNRRRVASLAERLTGIPGRADLDHAATWLFNSRAVEQASRERGGWTLPRSRVVHPGIDDVLFTYAEPQPWQWRLLYLGRMDPRKGVDLAIDALKLLPPEATLVLQGSGDREYITRLRESADPLLGRVTFSSHGRECLRDVYADADVVLFPVQWEEPWGLVPLEAMAVGRPVVATGTGGSREYLRHEENCMLYEPRDSPEALAAAVTSLAEDDALRDRVRRRGVETASIYTEAAYNEAIEEALAEASATGG